MPYISSRGSAGALNFDDVILAGLAADGGLYVPNKWPKLSEDIFLPSVDSYQKVVEKVVAPYLKSTNIYHHDDVVRIIHDAYQEFTSDEVVPLTPIGDQRYIMELYHGPTLAFKDIPLQALGRLLSHLLKARQERMTFIGATSGDTGSAAIAACGYSDHMQVFILHPKGRTSEVQRRQMTTVDSPNVYNIAVDGTFDDCQSMVKAMIKDPVFCQDKNLGLVNSINWGRILFQIPYYVYAYKQLKTNKISFSVPTGNFGDVYAGYAATRMGLNTQNLIVGTNQNDILARFLKNGVYERGEVFSSISPSIDIQVASNFERFLFDVFAQEGAGVKKAMHTFETTGRLEVSADQLEFARGFFQGERVSEQETIESMTKLYEEKGVIIDPHTAVAMAAADRRPTQGDVPMVILSTAHPIKFPEVVERVIKKKLHAPPKVEALYHKEERYVSLPNDLEIVKDYLTSNCWS